MWIKSSFCESGACVELNMDIVLGTVFVRHSAEPQERVLLFTRQEWDAFIAGAKAGEFDLS